jgi:N-acetyl sugar amidotransferase
MIRCKRCLLPDTKPDLLFDAEGVCSACRSFDKRAGIDWAQRKDELLQILEEYGPECLVASSGGKDSTYIAFTLQGLGFRPTVITATTCFLTEIGRKNIDNLARHFSTIEYTAKRAVRAKLNRYGLELVGDISWPEHASIFSVPIRFAIELGFPLVFYGENPQAEYGGPIGADESLQMSRRWVTEFGGFLGLRPSDFVGREGITEEDMADYEVPKGDWPAICFLGQFIPWDSHRNAKVAAEHGVYIPMQTPSRANYWAFENLDNAMTGLHDHVMFRKYGFGRACSQISVDIRHGKLSRSQGETICKAIDGLYPFDYMGVPHTAVIERLGMKPEAYKETLKRHTNWELFTPDWAGWGVNLREAA